MSGDFDRTEWNDTKSQLSIAVLEQYRLSLDYSIERWIQNSFDVCLFGLGPVSRPPSRTFNEVLSIISTNADCRHFIFNWKQGLRWSIDPIARPLVNHRKNSFIAHCNFIIKWNPRQTNHRWQCAAHRILDHLLVSKQWTLNRFWWCQFLLREHIKLQINKNALNNVRWTLS